MFLYREFKIYFDFQDLIFLSVWTDGFKKKYKVDDYITIFLISTAVENFPAEFPRKSLFLTFIEYKEIN